MAIALQNVRKNYTAPDGSTTTVINVASFAVGDGEQVALIGTSGSGKTTLLHLIAGILTPDSGRVGFGPGEAPKEFKFDGGTIEYRNPHPNTLTGGWRDITQLPEQQRDIFRGQNIGYIFQTHHLLPGFTALENVLLGMTFTGRASDPKWARHLLSEVGLSERLNYKPEKLSVGQQQRVAVARALANRPKLVLADEPTGALDSNNAKQVLGLIRSLCQEVGASLVLVTHDLEIAKQFPRTVTLADINNTAAVV